MIRNDAETKHIGLLLTSASPSILQDCKRYQADDCIEKPFDLYELEEKIKSMLA